MKFLGDGNWQLEFFFPDDVDYFEYNYCLTSNDSWTCNESGKKRRVDLKDVREFGSLLLEDIWQSSTSPEVSPEINSSLFTKVVFGRENQKPVEVKPFSSFSAKADTVVIRFNIHCVHVPPSSTIKICGAIPELGDWDPTKAPELSSTDFPFWRYTLEVPRSRVPFAYKYTITGGDLKHPQWEYGGDRYFNSFGFRTVRRNEGVFRKNLEWRGAGASVPVFSLRTKSGLGVGEFKDIKLLVDWAVQCGLRVIQVLPINDTTVRNDWRDSYPYSANSVFALHPMYVHLDALTQDAALLKEIDETRTKLNALPTVDYEAVVSFKHKTMKKIFSQTKEKFLGGKEFQEWLKSSEYWVAPYALFSVLREKFGTSDWAKWGDMKDVTREQVKELTSPKSTYYNDVAYHFYVQYNLHLQLKDAADYAAKKGVGIKGDIAIGVNPKSVDTWIEPRLFRLTKSTGAPPDVFSETGQNWGFPTYNWDEMYKDDYAWWRARLSQMALYFDAFRIDHILGFFRIWEIPGNCVTGLLGHFYPSIPLWRDELAGRGVWDFNRLTEPYIKSHILERFFGAENVPEVIEKYLDEIGLYTFRLKPEFSNEKLVDAALPTVPTSTLTQKQADRNRIFRDGLFKLIQNVVLLRDEDNPNCFYPRIEMVKTTSYAELDDPLKNNLISLYVDYFYRRQEGLWTETAMQRLPIMVGATKMLCCGEDLGMVPACVEPVMRGLRILGLRIQRMPDDPKKEFMHPGEYNYLTVCTPSVHDTSTLRGWWEEDRATTQRFYNWILGESGPAPLFCDSHTSYKIIRQHFESRAMWSIIPMQDLFGLNFNYFNGKDPKDERINVPAIAEHYWRYRIHVSLEQLLDDKEFIQHIRELVRSTGRLV